MTNDHFWKSTIQEIYAAIDAKELRREYETDFERAMIYMSEGLRRTKRMPTMNAWLTHGKRRQATEDEVIKARNDHQTIMRNLPINLKGMFMGGA